MTLARRRPLHRAAIATATPAIFATIAAIAIVILSATLGAYALAADRARAMLRSSRAMRYVQRAAAGVIAGVAVAIAAR